MRTGKPEHGTPINTVYQVSMPCKHASSCSWEHVQNVITPACKLQALTLHHLPLLGPNDFFFELCLAWERLE